MALEIKQLDGARVYFPSAERETAEFLAVSYEQDRVLLKEMWGLQPPDDLRFVVLRGVWDLILRLGPLWARLLLIVMLPLYWRQVR